MNPFVAAWGWAKIFGLTLGGRTVGTGDWGPDYDRVAATYDAWNERMAAHTLKILPPEWIAAVRDRPIPVRILDLACGNGTVTRALLSALAGAPITIVGVDLSPLMIENCRRTIIDPRVTFVQAEGLAFLQAQPHQRWDAVFCGWGLVYLPKGRVLHEIHRTLVPGGLVGAIMNVRGTLGGVEEAYLDTMVEDPTQVAKVMTIRFSLPSPARFDLWFRRRGLHKIGGGWGEETVVCSSPGELLRWLRETGAVAGCDHLFHNFELVRRRLIGHLGRRMAREGTWQVTHRFVYGHYIATKRSLP